MTSGELDRTIERLEAATAEARAAIREAHEAMQGLRDATRNALAAKGELTTGVNGLMIAAAKDAIATMTQATTKAIEQSEAAVFRRFEQLTKALMDGEDNVSLERLAANWRYQAEHARRAGVAEIPAFYARRKAGGPGGG